MSTSQNDANIFPFSFTDGQYCLQVPPPLPPLGFAAAANQEQGNTGDQQQQPVQQNPQQSQQQQLDRNMEIVASFLEKNSNGGESLQSCRYCQQKFFLSADGLAKHEMSCPVNMQVQQLLQQQQRNELQQQLQLQHNQLQQQFQQQQQLNFGSFLPTQLAPSQDTMTSLQGQLSQAQGLDLLSQQSLSMEYNQQASSDQQGTNSPIDFESEVANLPTFDPPSKQSDPNAADYFPLCLPEDETWLTPLHCFVRKYCVEVFVATPEDVAAPCMGKRNPVNAHQVGIRCPYCSPERLVGKINEIDIARARENGVVFPSLISRIYNATINLLQRHLRTCAFVPPEILARYEELKQSSARSGASKKYWADSAAKLGLVDTMHGIRLDKDIYLKAKHEIGAAPKGTHETSQAPIVLPTEKRFTTAFTFHLMSQVQPCTFTEADRLGRRRGLAVGYAGLACCHCVGEYGSGRFFPSSVKTMSDASKTLDVIYKHMCKCKKCPPRVKNALHELRRFHDSERSKMPFGNQRAFFSKIWSRLHENDDVSDTPPQQAPPPVASMPAVARSDPPSLSMSSIDVAPESNPPLPPLLMPSLLGGTEGADTGEVTKPHSSSTESCQGMIASINRTNSVEFLQNKVAPESA